MRHKSTAVLCEQCGNPFNVDPYEARSATTGKFCSRLCYYTHKKTHHKPVADRFWRKVNKTDTCWLWTAASNIKGYGVIRVTGRGNILAHRLAYELTYGPIPDNLWVLHRCDVPACCNPQHLFLGDVADNVHDAMDKGRASAPPIHAGEANQRAVLTPDVVRAIREASAAGMSQRAIGLKFGTTQHNVWSIVHRITWGDVQ